MTLDDLLADVPGAVVTGPAGIEVTGLAYDSRRVRPGDAFFALPGLAHEGVAFVPQALERGAVAVVAVAPVEAPGRALARVDDPRGALADAACRFHAYPSRSLRVVGITGTNGKTTTTYLLEGIFRKADWVPAVVGTTGVRLKDERRPSLFTTPEAPELQALLRELSEVGVDAVAIEVSSHALAQRRSRGLECDVAVFTNLTHDHLDYHGTLERYLDAKLMLFDGRNAPRAMKPLTAVLNADDPHAPAVRAAAATGAARAVSFGAATSADVRIEALEVGPEGLAFALAEGAARVAVRLPRLGRFNAWNAAGAFAAARALGVSAEVAAAGLESAPEVPGRLERVDEGQPFAVVVDYAHTPDALARALAAVREHAAGHVLVVFGCGGDRDRAKRPVMGDVAERGADRVWITSDNPRSEPPEQIAREIAAGMRRPAPIVLDRREAIDAAIRLAEPGDGVLIAGKGHETTQTIGERVLPFDDRVVARERLLRRFGAGR